MAKCLKATLGLLIVVTLGFIIDCSSTSDSFEAYWVFTMESIIDFDPSAVANLVGFEHSIC